MSETLNEAALRIAREVWGPESIIDEQELDFARRLRAEWEKEGQEPSGFIYEWDGPFGIHRGLYYGIWNRNRPDRAIPYYLHPIPAPKEVDQMQQDAADMESPEYWRGHDAGVAGVAMRWEEALTKPIPAPGVMNEPLEGLYRRTEALRAKEVEKGSEPGICPKCGEQVFCPACGSRLFGGTNIHTDHPSRHYDRTCPACATDPQEEPVARVNPKTGVLEPFGNWGSLKKGDLLYTRPQHDDLPGAQLELDADILHAKIAEQAARITKYREAAEHNAKELIRAIGKLTAITSQRDRLVESAREVIKHHGSDDVLELAAVLEEVTK